MRTEQEIIENLKDAGCCEESIEDFMKCFRNGDMKKGMKVIESCRKDILSDTHEGQRKIDCLDYLAYQIVK